MPAVVAFHAAHLVEHADEVLVIGINPPLDKRTATSHRAVQVMDQLTAPIGIQSVGIRHQPQSAWSIEQSESEATSAQVIVDRNAHPGTGGEVEDRPSWCSEVEVDQSDGNPVVEDDVLQTYVVVAEHGTACGVSQFVAPGAGIDGNLRRRLVKPTHESSNRRQSVVRLCPLRKRRDRYLTLDEHESLSPISLNLDGEGCTRESGGSKLPQKLVDRLRSGVRRSQHELATPYDSSGICHASVKDLVHRASLPRTAACCLRPAACCLHPAAYTLPPDEWGTVGPLHALDAWNHKRHIPLASEQPAIARSLPLPLPPPVAQLVNLIVAGRTIVPVGVVIGERMKERAPEL